eukprot:TRINITY_DN6939_c0_g1_i1.p1 TRINITY_DN6939_c0_g1~~TRINITY_DN6939_c0_g1_i1.p1  ORF type:complete len:229 (-),score=32.43 TRINITY_DN6939_c0_g1_i1:108-794(-)
MEVNKKQRRRRGVTTEHVFHTFIYKILKNISNDIGISIKGMTIMNSLVMDLYQRLMNEAKQLSLVRKTTTLLPETIFAAGRLLVSHPLHTQLVEFTSQIIKNYSEKSGTAKTSSATPTSVRAGLQMPSGRFLRLMRQKWKQGVVRSNAAIAMAATVEKIVMAVLEHAERHTRESKHNRIIPRYLMLAIRSDECLDKLFPGTISSGGVLPNIMPQLLPRTMLKHGDDDM